ncbi:MAG: NfeD family protein [Spirochaetia bacterium]|nr:NfeD family protein [Spirochaetia bacterium]
MIDFIMSNLFWFWLAVFVIMVVIEAMTVALVSIWCGVSAFIMIFLSRTEMPFKWQLLIFLLVSAVLMLFTRPFFVKKLKLGKNKMNTDAIEGTKMKVLEPISQFQKGTVKAQNGVVWNAESADEESLSSGEICVVKSVKGNTLVVQKVKED